MLDRDIENGMTVCAEKPQTIHACPRCGAEWEQLLDLDPVGVGVIYYEHGFTLTRRYPIHRGFCRACAMDDAKMEDHVRFIRERNLIGCFFVWLVSGATVACERTNDLLDIWNLLVQHDPDLLDIRLREYIEDERKDDFIDWRAGYDA